MKFNSIQIYFIDQEICSFTWDGDKVVMRIDTPDKSHQETMKDLYDMEGFFNPETESHEVGDAKDDFSKFLIKICPELFKYGYSYEVE